MSMGNYDEGFSTYNASYDNALRLAGILSEAIAAQSNYNLPLAGRF